MLIIADSSSIINLLNFKALELVYNCYDKILIPKKVYEELTTKYYFDEKIKILNNNTHIEIKEINNRDLIKDNEDKKLHEGEKEAIILALETQEKNILIDDNRGKLYSLKYNLNIETTASIIIKNFKNKNIHISEFKNIFANMLENTMFDKKSTEKLKNLVFTLNQDNQEKIIKKFDEEIPIIKKGITL